MIEDQEFILSQIIEIIDSEHPDAVLIAGDVYDKSVPSAEAVTLLDDFLCRLAERNLPVLIISGNHDSPERLAFGGRLMEGAGIHVSPVYSGNAESVTLSDEHGAVTFWLLPFVKPIHVKRCFPDEAIESYTDAIRAAIGELKEPYRPVCSLCLLEEKSPEEAALALGRPVKTIHTQLARGKRLLRERLERSETHGHLST